MSNTDGYGQNNGFDQQAGQPADAQHGGAFQSGNVHDAPTQYGSSGANGAQPAYGDTQQRSYDQQGYGSAGAQHDQNAPYGQAAYGQPQQTSQYGYGQQQGPYTQAAGGMPQSQPYASWGKRVGAYLIDMLLTLPFGIVAAIAMPKYTVYENADGSVAETKFVGGNMLLVTLMELLSFAVVIWNQGYRQGTTGQSIGKKVLGTKLVSEQTGQPVGVGKAILRQIAHILDALPCYLGFLWPLWDAKKQTFADKVTGTVVVDEPKR